MASDGTGVLQAHVVGAHGQGEHLRLMPYGQHSDVALSDTGPPNACVEVSYLEEIRGPSLGRAKSSSLDLMMQRVGICEPKISVYSLDRNACRFAYAKLTNQRMAFLINVDCMISSVALLKCDRLQ